MDFAIITIKKFVMGALGGLGRHNERVGSDVRVEEETEVVATGAAKKKDPPKKIQRANQNIFGERVKDNYHLVEPVSKNYKTCFEDVCIRNGVDLKKQHIRTEGKKRDQSKVVFAALVVSPWAFDGPEKSRKDLLAAGSKQVGRHYAYMHEDRHRKYFDAALDELKQKYGAANIVSAVVHMDEMRPHLHVTIVPVVKGTSIKTNKKTGEVTKTEVNKVRMTDVWREFNSYGKLQDWFHGRMVARGFDVARGIKRDPTDPKFEFKDIASFKRAEELKGLLDKLLPRKGAWWQLGKEQAPKLETETLEKVAAVLVEFFACLPAIQNVRKLSKGQRANEKLRKQLEKLKREAEAELKRREDEVIEGERVLESKKAAHREDVQADSKAQDLREARLDALDSNIKEREAIIDERWPKVQDLDRREAELDEFEKRLTTVRDRDFAANQKTKDELEEGKRQLDIDKAHVQKDAAKVKLDAEAVAARERAVKPLEEKIKVYKDVEAITKVYEGMAADVASAKKTIGDAGMAKEEAAKLAELQTDVAAAKKTIEDAGKVAGEAAKLAALSDKVAVAEAKIAEAASLPDVSAELTAKVTELGEVNAALEAGRQGLRYVDTAKLDEPDHAEYSAAMKRLDNNNGPYYAHEIRQMIDKVRSGEVLTGIRRALATIRKVLPLEWAQKAYDAIVKTEQERHERIFGPSNVSPPIEPPKNNRAD